MARKLALDFQKIQRNLCVPCIFSVLLTPWPHNVRLRRLKVAFIFQGNENKIPLY
jgi:hypothetical protein